MRPPRSFRHLAYALLATLVSSGVWDWRFQSYDGGWILWGALGLFVVLVALDWVVVNRLRAGHTPAA